jgi:hypothetical protein
MVRHYSWKRSTHETERPCGRTACVIGVLIAAISVCASPPAFAQMVTGENIPGFGETFAVKVGKDAPKPLFEANLVECSIPGNILWPGDEASFTFQVVNHQAEALKTKGKVDVVAYGTKGRPGDIWIPDMLKISDAGSVEFAVDLAPQGFTNVTVKPAIPARFGAYGLVVDLGPAGRRFLTSCVRTFAAEPTRVQFPKLGCDVGDVNVLKRIGCKSIRRGWHWKQASDPEFERWYKEEGATLMKYHEANVSIILEIGGGPDKLKPWNLWMRSHLNDQGEGPMGYPGDGTWMPSGDEEFSQFVEKICTDYGWPKGPLVAINLWNEPWEGSSIAGWGADMLRFREMTVAMGRGVEAARAKGAQVLMGGTDSSMNTFDKFFPDGKDDFLKYLDFLSIHYQGLAPASTVKAWVDRKSPYGRVKIWDTESWVANVDDRVPVVLAVNISSGHDRAVGIYGGNIAEEPERPILQPDGKKKNVRTTVAWSVAASVGAAQHFLGERDFDRLLFTNGLPWVLVFHGQVGKDGQPDPEDATVVVVGDIGDEFGHDGLLFRTARGFAELKHKPELKKQLAALPGDTSAKDRQKLERAIAEPETLSDATMVIKDVSGSFSLYDFYGNPVPSKDGQIVVPLDHRGFYLRGNGRPGSFAALLQAIRESRVEGIEPLATQAHDLLGPVDKGATLKLTLTDVLNRPVKGKLTVKLGHLKVEPATQDLAFNGHDTKMVELKVSGEPARDNRYPLSLAFDAGKDGVAVHEEVMHVNVIARRTINVDGNLEDWKDVLPQTIIADQKSAPSLTEAAWFPYKKFDDSVKNGLATAYLAYDDNCFYFAAKIADDSPEDGMRRYEMLNEDEFFYPEKCVWVEKGKDGKPDKRSELTWPAGVRRFSYRKEPDLPSGNFPNHDNVQIAFNVLSPEAKPWYSHPPGTMPGYTGYKDTDYEYALNPVAAKYGGGAEIWRLEIPGMPHKNFYPRQPKSPLDGPVKGGKLVCKRDGNTRIVECAIPWGELPDVKKKRDAGQPIKFSYRVNDSSGGGLELSRNRSVAKRNNAAFHVEWIEHWANEVEFAFER